MTAEEAYIKFIYQAEQSGSLRNISVSRGAFAILYNRQRNVVVKFHINNRYDEIEEDINDILVSNKELGTLTHHEPTNSYVSELPEDFLSESHSFLIAKNDKCEEGVKCTALKIRDKDRDFYLTNENYKPSFDWREFIYDIKDGDINYYVDQGTTVDKAYLTYYKYPTKIDIDDPNNPEGQFTTTELGLGELMVDRIIASCVATFKGSNDDYQGYSVSKNEQNENLK